MRWRIGYACRPVMEDWIRLETLEARAGSTATVPRLDPSGILRFRDSWVALSPVEQGIAIALIDRFGAVVGHEVLSRWAWPSGIPTRNALDVHMLHFRRRIAPVGLEVRTVRSRGYLLQAVTTSAEI